MQKSILIAREPHRVISLVKNLQQLGVDVNVCPVISITNVLPTQLEKNLSQLDKADLIIFVSVNAVVQFVQLLEANYVEMSTQTQVAVLGDASARACAQAGLRVDIMPKGRFDSEGLLAALVDVDLNGKTVHIYRGQSGRELLGNTIGMRGGIVHYIECYRREIAFTHQSILEQYYDSKKWDYIVVSSCEVADALNVLLGKSRLNLSTIFILAFSGRIATYCQTIWPLTKVYTLKLPIDESILAIIQR